MGAGVGELIAGRFRVVSELGRGGMAVVYLAEELSGLRREVALKLTLPGMPVDSMGAHRLAREGRALAQLQHPNILEVYDAGVLPDGRRWYSMPRLRGESLFQRLRRGPLPVARAVELARDLASALEHAHRAGIVHRDLKPANVFLEQVGGREVTKVLDFGIARITSDPSLTQLTAAGHTLGTPGYMPPEQICGSAIDGRSDVYALGCILFELVTGERVFGRGEEMLSLLRAHMETRPRRLRSVGPGSRAPLALERLVGQMLEKFPEKRPSSMSEVRAELEQVSELLRRLEAPLERRFGSYSVLLKLASRGPKWRTMVAQRDGAEEICVLKQLLGEVAEHETAVKRFHREAKLAAYLDHRHIARVLDAGFEGGTFCIAMEYVLGKDLEAMSHHLVKQGRLLPYPVSLASILGALDGLAYAHKATDPGGKPLQLVHRDLSPRNVMLSTSGVVKVIDFGVARSDSGDFRTAPGMLVGTLRYVSPEQAVAEGVDARSDLYSLSVVLHELLTGHYLVPSGEPMKVLRHVVTESLPPVHTLNPDLPPKLGEVIQKGLAKNRDERWPDAATYRQALLEAAGPLAEAEESQLGSFVRSFFEDEMAVGEAVISFGQERFVQAVAEGSLTQAKALSEATRTGFVAASRVVPQPLSGEGEAPAHLGTVVPVELTSPGASTASFLRGEPGAWAGPSVLGTEPVRLEPVVSEAGAPALDPAVAAAPRDRGRRSKVGLAIVGVLGLVALSAVMAGELRRGARVEAAAPVDTPPASVPRAAVVAFEPAAGAETQAPSAALDARSVEPVRPVRGVEPRRTSSKSKPRTLAPDAPRTPVPEDRRESARQSRVDREIDRLIEALEEAPPPESPSIRGRLTEIISSTHGAAGRFVTRRLAALAPNGTSANYRKLMAEIRALRDAADAP